MKKYKFYGYCNIFSIFPSFTYPIFCSDDEFYFQEYENDIIFNFEKINMDYLLEHNNVTKIESDIKKVLGEKAFYVFEVNRKISFYGERREIREVLSILDNSLYNDDIIKQKVSKFIESDFPSFDSSILFMKPHIKESEYDLDIINDGIIHINGNVYFQKSNNNSNMIINDNTVFGVSYSLLTSESLKSRSYVKNYNIGDIFSYNTANKNKLRLADYMIDTK